jgi:UDP-3-O-[3-hydroxymyristoyl] glucosamine N-acyltransferase
MEKMTRTLSELALLVKGEVCGDPDVLIHGLGDIATARADEITFITTAAREDMVTKTAAAAIIVPLAVTTTAKPLIRVKDPYLAAALIHRHFLAAPFVATGISARAAIGADCRIPAAVSIGPLAVLGDRVVLGERVTIHSGAVIGDGVMIGADTVIYPHVTIYKGCRLGARVIIHAGAVIGSDGFGYATDEGGGHVKRPHVGTVRIDDDVEVGANTCIDRATFGETWIQQGTKIDNLVQVGHNVVIGAGSIVVAQVGIAGSATLGRGNVLGGQAGIKGHICLGDRVMVAARSGVHGNVQAGAVVSGYPAIPHKQWLKAITLFSKLPKMFQEIRDLKKQMITLQKDRLPAGESEIE